MILSEHKERGFGCGTPHQFSRIRRGKYTLIGCERKLVWGTNRPAKLGGVFHESKVAGVMASASGSFHWLDRVLLCDFDDFGLLVWLQWFE